MAIHAKKEGFPKGNCHRKQKNRPMGAERDLSLPGQIGGIVGEDSFDIVAGTFFYLDVDLADVLADEADGQKLYAAQKPDGQHN